MPGRVPVNYSFDNVAGHDFSFRLVRVHEGSNSLSFWKIFQSRVARWKNFLLVCILILGVPLARTYETSIELRNCDAKLRHDFRSTDSVNLRTLTTTKKRYVKI